MESMLDGNDYMNVAEALQEVSGLTDRTLQIKRNTGFTGGALNGVAPKPNYEVFNFMGTVEAVTQQEAVLSGGELALGDIRLTTTIPVLGKGEGGGGYTIQEGDVLIYLQKEWRITGIPKPEDFAGGSPFTMSFWRRT